MLEVLQMLAAQVLGVRIDWFEVLEVLCRQLGGCRYYYPSRDVGFLVCRLPFGQVLVCLHIGWFEVLEVLEGERCLDRCVLNYHPSRDAGFLVCPPAGFVVNTVVTSGGSTIL